MKKTTSQILSPLKAIRAKCLDCSGNMKNEVRLCPCSDCSLYPYRHGKNPNRQRVLSEEDRKIISQRFSAVRQDISK